MMDYTDTENKSWRNKLVEYSEPVFTVIFTFECFVKIIGTGLIIGKGTYLADPWNWIDFLVVISGLLSSLPQMANVSGLRTFRLFRPLRSLSTLPNIRILIGTLLASVAQLGGVLSLALFFFLIFAILGVNLFAGLTHYRCRETPYPVQGDWEPVESDKRLCGDRKCPEGWCGSLVEAHDNFHNVTVNDVYRDSEIEELNYGLTNFDNIFNAFLTIFQCITLEGWTDIMYMMQDAYSKYISAIYFVLAVVVCAFFLINLTIAIMLKNYDELDKNEKNTSHQANLIELGMQTKLPSRLIYFIVGEENLIVSKKAKKRLKDQSEHGSFKNQFISSFIYTKIEIPNENYYKYRITRFFYFLVSVPLFGTIILVFILLNTIILSLERYPMPRSEQEAYNKVNYFFSSVFAIEVVLKVIGLSPKKFIMDKFNIFDSVIVLMSVLELFLSSGSGGVSALRAFRLFRIFKLFRTGNLRVLLDSIAYTMSTIGNYVILLGLFIYVYSLLGMQFFAGKLTFDENGYYDPNGEVPRANFDNLYWAAITVFEVLIGDDWHNVMYDCVKAVGVLSSLYFISLILFGSIIMLNLFLAILLGNFDKARSFWLKKSIFEMFETAIANGYSLSKAINIILGQVSTSVKEELLVHEPRDIYRLNGRLSILNRKLMINNPEEEDKIYRLDKIANYEMDYNPIIEFIAEEEKQVENEEDSGKGDSLSDKEDYHTTKFHNLKRFKKEQNDKLSNSVAENQKAHSGHSSGMKEQSESEVENKPRIMKPTPEISGLKPALKQVRDKDSTALDNKDKARETGFDIKDNFTQKGKEDMRFVTLGTPREKVEDLEQIKRENHSQDEHKFTKSVSFDFQKLPGNDANNPQEEEEKKEDIDDKTSDEEAHEYFKEDIDDVLVPVNKPKKKWYWKVYDYAKNSSLFIFHKDWKFRKALIALVVSPEVEQEYLAKKKENIPYDHQLDGNSPKNTEPHEVNKTVKVTNLNEFEDKKEAESKKFKSFEAERTNSLIPKPNHQKTFKITDSIMQHKIVAGAHKKSK